MTAVQPHQPNLVRCDRCRWRDRRDGVCCERYALASGRYVAPSHRCARFAVRVESAVRASKSSSNGWHCPPA